MRGKFAWDAWLCGLAMLIPLPFLDSYVERRLTMRLLARLAVHHGRSLPDSELRILTEDRGSLVWGCMGTLVIWPIKKLFRTVLYFLTVKDVLDSVTLAAHRATLVDRALVQGMLPGRATEVRDGMDATLGRTRHSPIGRWVLREPRPALGWDRPTERIGRVVHSLQRHGGGAIIVEAFDGHLERTMRGRDPAG